MGKLSGNINHCTFRNDHADESELAAAEGITQLQQCFNSVALGLKMDNTGLCMFPEQTTINSFEGAPNSKPYECIGPLTPSVDIMTHNSNHHYLGSVFDCADDSEDKASNQDMDEIEIEIDFAPQSPEPGGVGVTNNLQELQDSSQFQRPYSEMEMEIPVQYVSTAGDNAGRLGQELARTCQSLIQASQECMADLFIRNPPSGDENNPQNFGRHIGGSTAFHIPAVPDSKTANSSFISHDLNSFLSTLPPYEPGKNHERTIVPQAPPPLQLPMSYVPGQNSCVSASTSPGREAMAVLNGGLASQHESQHNVSEETLFSQLMQDEFIPPQALPPTGLSTRNETSRYVVQGQQHEPDVLNQPEVQPKPIARSVKRTIGPRKPHAGKAASGAKAPQDSQGATCKEVQAEVAAPSPDMHLPLPEEVSEQDQIRMCFNIPIQEAAKRLGVGVTVLKRKCRHYGIPRWPYRKLKSLDKLYESMTHLEQENGDNAGEIRSTKLKLFVKRESMVWDPAINLDAETKKLRQSNFKHEYRVRHGNSEDNPEEMMALDGTQEALLLDTAVPDSEANMQQPTDNQTACIGPAPAATHPVISSSSEASTGIRHPVSQTQEDDAHSSPLRLATGEEKSQ